jgi:Myb-like DNA-binding domain
MQIIACVSPCLFRKHGEACRQLLGQANAVCVDRLIPGAGDLSDHFLEPQEHLSPSFKPPCTVEQALILRKNRTFFTVGEDSLVLRGVNLYGEKQWGLVCNRFLPNRSTNFVAQRYSTICTHLYKARGIGIDSEGNLDLPPEYLSIDDVDPGKLATVHEVPPPAIINVHRWSLDEDLNLLRVVPIMGHMWAEIAARVLPHRDRGHIRKRYQVLSRRVKTAVQRMNNALLQPSLTQVKTPPRHRNQLSRESADLEVPSPSSSRKAGTPKAVAAQTTRSERKSSPQKARARKLSDAMSPPSNARGIGVAAPGSKQHSLPFASAAPHPRTTAFPRAAGHAPTAAFPRAAVPFSMPNKSLSFPHHAYPNAAAASDDASRVAFEQLAEANGPECSQLRRIGNMMSRDDATRQGNSSLMAAGNTLSRLSGLPFAPSGVDPNRREANGSLDTFPDMNMGDDPSGLSVLRSPENARHERKHGFTSAPSTFLTGVLDRTRQLQSNGSRPPHSLSYSDALGNAPRDDIKHGNGAESDSHFPSTPSKRQVPGLDSSSHGLPPFYSPEGAHNLNAAYSPPLTVDQGHSSMWGGLSLLNGDVDASHGGGDPLQQQILPPARPRREAKGRRSSAPSRTSNDEAMEPPPFAMAPTRRSSQGSAAHYDPPNDTRSPSSSSAASSSLLLPPETSIPLFGVGSRSPSTSSRTSTRSAAAYASPLVAVGNDGADAAADHDDDDGAGGTHLMEMDLEAISALNSLSHSPAEKLESGRGRASSREAGSGSVSARQQSLFSRVVGLNNNNNNSRSSASSSSSEAATATAPAPDRDRDRRRTRKAPSNVVTAKKRRLKF